MTVFLVGPKKFEFAGENAPKFCVQSASLHKDPGTAAAKAESVAKAKSKSDNSASSRAVDRLKNDMSVWMSTPEGITPVCVWNLCHLCGHFQGDCHPPCAAGGAERQKTSAEKNCASYGKH